jgi:hypothetical protein
VAQVCGLGGVGFEIKTEPKAKGLTSEEVSYMNAWWSRLAVIIQNSGCVFVRLEMSGVLCFVGVTEISNRFCID